MGKGYDILNQAQAIMKMVTIQQDALHETVTSKIIMNIPMSMVKGHVKESWGDYFLINKYTVDRYLYFH